MSNNESTIRAMFSPLDRQFVIPPYQRAYSWEEPQLKQFIDDLKDAQGSYYLGHFLFRDMQNSVRHIIDGQQRLTTIVIFFSTLRKELQKEKHTGTGIDVADLSECYFKHHRKGTQKLRTVDYDNNFFLEEIIEGRGDHSVALDTLSKKRIRAAKLFFEKEFAEASTEELAKWCDLVQKATITEFVASQPIEATRIFAFQNDRGRKLSNLEVIKAYLMLQVYLSTDSDDKANAEIEYVESELSNIYKQIARIKEGEDSVLNYYWRAVGGRGYDSQNVVEEIKGKLLDLPLGEKRVQWIKNFVAGLSKAFITVESFENSKDVSATNLRYLNNLALAYPFIIKAEAVPAEDRAKKRLLDILENLTFRSLVRGGRAELESRLKQYLTRPADQFDIMKVINSIIHNLKVEPWWEYWNDEEMVRNLSSEYFYGNRVDNYVLWRYELHLGGLNHPAPHLVSYGDLITNESIEHIAPLTPTDGQPLANGYGVYEDADSPEQGVKSGRLLHSIGNLMLISQSHNSSIGNKPFVDKLASYGRDNLLKQQKEIIEFVADPDNPVWNADAIRRRGAKILAAAQNIWDLDKI